MSTSSNTTRTSGEPLKDLYLYQELDEAQSKFVQRRIRDGELVRMSPKMATSIKDESQWPALVKMHRNRIVASHFPKAVFTGVCSLNGGLPTAEGVLYLTHTHRKELSLPGLTIKARAGCAALPGDMPVRSSASAPEDHVLFYPSTARQLIDNILDSKEGSAGANGVEGRLQEILRARGFQYFQQLRQEIIDTAKAMCAHKESGRLQQLMGELMGTREIKDLKSALMLALAHGYDAQCLEKMENLAAALRATPLPVLDSRSTGTLEARMNEAFLESYFSNYIEGTEFEVEEAIQIVMNKKVSPQRPGDSLDVQVLYDAILGEQWRSRCVNDTDRPLTEIRARHAAIMGHRPDVEPGVFKTVANMAGNTRFTLPHLVNGTLAKAITMLDGVPPGLARAIFLHTMMVTVHPFNDGNGRLSRMMMNAELSHLGLQRIIVPTLFREEYIDTLSSFCADGEPSAFIKALTNCQKWTAAFDYNDLQGVTALMARCNAMQKSLVQYRLLMPEAVEIHDDAQPNEDESVQSYVGSLFEQRLRG